MFIFIAISLLLINIVNGFSACNEIDITFVVDTDNVIHNTDAVIEFIVSIINDGSSEQAGFSVVLYDNKMPNDFNIKLITLDETASITQRSKAEAQVEIILENKFNEIIQFSKQGATGKKVNLLDAFKVGNKQHRPKRDLNYKKKLGFSVDDKTIGAHDDDKVYFIFDFNNHLIDNDMNDICTLFQHLDTNAVENDDESIHFLMGQEYTKSNINNIKCNNKKPKQIKWNTFYHFEDELIFNKELMEQIYAITCPATIQAPKFGGSMNLGNHVQWIDIKTIVKCNLVYYDIGGKMRQDELDITKSYIEVKDYLNDDNTFKLNDYLLTIEKDAKVMQKMGCTAPIVKIVKIRKSKKVYGKGGDRQYQILKLYLTLPKSPMEYLLDCSINGDVKVDIDDKHTDKFNNEYNSAYNAEYADNLNADELDEYINNYNEDFDFDFDNAQELESIYEFFNINENDFDMFELNDIEELYTIYGEYLYYKYGTDYWSSLPSWSSMKNAASGATTWARNKVSSGASWARNKASNAWNNAKQKASQAKAWGSKKLQQAKTAAVHTWNKGKALAKKGWEKTKQVAQKISNTKIQISKQNYQLANLNFKGDYTWKKTLNAAINIKVPSFIDITFHGLGQATVNWGYAFNFQMKISFNFDWQIFKGNTKIMVKLHGDWSIMAYANIKIRGELSIMLNNILNYGHTFTIFVYGVPIIFRPYVALDARVELLPIEVYAGIECEYAQDFAVGYYYDNTVTPTNKYPIKKIKTTKKGCKRKFKLNESEKGECPVAELGFNLMLEPRIGIELYYIINTHIKFQFVIPFRIEVPEKNLAVCGGSGDFCNTRDKKLYASFSVAMKLKVYLAAYIDLEKFMFVIKGLFKKIKPIPRALPKPRGIQVGPTMTIMKKKHLGCMKLTGILSPLNNYYRGRCCSGNGNGNVGGQGNGQGNGHGNGHGNGQGNGNGNGNVGGQGVSVGSGRTRTPAPLQRSMSRNKLRRRSRNSNEMNTNGSRNKRSSRRRSSNGMSKRSSRRNSNRKVSRLSRRRSSGSSGSRSRRNRKFRQRSTTGSSNRRGSSRSLGNRRWRGKRRRK